MRRSIVTTFGSIGLTKAVQLVFPLITIPYLARTIGVSNMGIIAFVQAIITYIAIIPDLGISISGPRWVSINRDNKQVLQRLLTNVFLGKLVALLGSILFLVLLVAIVPQFRKYWYLFLFASPAIVSGLFAPVWFFLGLQKMWGFSLSLLFAYFFNTLGIFLFIHFPADYPLVIIFSSVTNIIQIAFSIFFLKKLGLHLFKVSFIDIPFCKKIISDSFPLFVSSLFGTFYGNIFVVVLGFTASEKTLGYYSAAERIIKAGLLMLGTFGQSLYPYLSKLYASSDKNAFNTFRKTAPITFSFALAMGVGTFLYSNVIISILYGSAFLPAVNILRILSILFILLGINDACGMQFFVPLGLVKKQLYATTTGLLTALFVIYPLCLYFGAYGAAYSYLLTELSVSFFMIISLVFVYKSYIPAKKIPFPKNQM